MVSMADEAEMVNIGRKDGKSVLEYNNLAA
jgi:hypothetical protein